MSGTMTIQESVAMFSEFGFDPIPLLPNQKKTNIRGWQQKSPHRLWSHAPNNANIGLRGQGEARVAFLDCDEKEIPGTFLTVQNWLAGLGHRPGSYPVVQTASGNGRHIYVSFSGELPGNARNLAEDIGAGEFRYGPAAFVVAPPSSVGGSLYQLLNGDFRQLPKLQTEDILPLLKNQAISTTAKRIKIPRRTMSLLKGNGIERYDSRSEFEQAILVGLINAGHSFEGIYELFQKFPAGGRFQDLHLVDAGKAQDYLKHSFDSAKRWASKNESQSRHTASKAMSWAESIPWPGRTGSCNLAVYLAHCEIAYQSGRLSNYHASSRRLAELAGVSQMTASRASKRLKESGLLQLERQSAGDCAHVWSLETKCFTTTQKGV